MYIMGYIVGHVVGHVVGYVMGYVVKMIVIAGHVLSRGIFGMELLHDRSLSLLHEKGDIINVINPLIL